MKKSLIAVIIIMIALIASSVFAARLFSGRPTYMWTATATSSAAAVTGQGIMAGICVTTDGTNAVTFNFYDNTSAAEGTFHLPTNYIIAASPRYQCFGFDPPSYFGTGLYVSVSVAGGGSCNYQINYDQ